MEKYIAKYFLNTNEIVSKFCPDNIVTIQFFQRFNNVMLCGIQEVLKLLKNQTDTSKYQIKYLDDGTIINSEQIVLELEGHYVDFGSFEGMIDGILARNTSIATNAMRIKKAANHKLVIAMADRADHYLMQAVDGYAINIGGIETQVTAMQVKSYGGTPIGTIPHALIQMFNGDLLKALIAYSDAFPQNKIIGLVDFDNDVINDSLKILKHFKERLFAVRVDTALNLVDKSLKELKIAEYGVNLTLISLLRKALDENEGQHVKIIVSSGFDEQKIVEFEKNKAPVDYYGVGKSLLNIFISFTADAVMLNHHKIAKVGRAYKSTKNLKIY